MNPGEWNESGVYQRGGGTLDALADTLLKFGQFSDMVGKRKQEDTFKQALIKKLMDAGMLEPETGTPIPGKMSQSEMVNLPNEPVQRTMNRQEYEAMLASGGGRTLGKYKTPVPENLYGGATAADAAKKTGWKGAYTVGSGPQPEYGKMSSPQIEKLAGLYGDEDSGKGGRDLSGMSTSELMRMYSLYLQPINQFGAEDADLQLKYLRGELMRRGSYSSDAYKFLYGPNGVLRNIETAPRGVKKESTATAPTFGPR